MTTSLRVLLLGALAMSGCSPCDTCEEYGDLFDACDAVWADEFEVISECADSFDSAWFDSAGQPSAMFEAGYDAVRRDCASGADAAQTCQARHEARRSAMTVEAKQTADDACRDSNEGALGEARRTLDCEGYLRARGIL